MSEKTTRNRRIRKKLYLDEFAILGFEFSCKLGTASEDDYDAFFNDFAQFLEDQHLYITLDSEETNEWLGGVITSADRYGNATEENREAFEAFLKANKIVSDIEVGQLADAVYGM
ncbi:YggL family protein [Neptunicella marina]|uniref:DUF469 family protein n=1 Tax=Neptunicella marina TaxID=2125989 RepID=A0A8J6IUX8_9ALTE|nr:50S ribosome-binding protein YggL [Neptunicella marina]MBC3766367.1 DUF469 family protein [Neptunicella marina]